MTARPLDRTDAERDAVSAALRRLHGEHVDVRVQIALQEGMAPRQQGLVVYLDDGPLAPLLEVRNAAAARRLAQVLLDAAARLDGEPHRIEHHTPAPEHTVAEALEPYAATTPPPFVAAPNGGRE